MKPLEVCSVTACLCLAKQVLQPSQTEALTLAMPKTKSAKEEVSKCKVWVAVLGLEALSGNALHTFLDFGCQVLLGCCVLFFVFFLRGALKGGDRIPGWLSLCISFSALQIAAIWLNIPNANPKGWLRGIIFGF